MSGERHPVTCKGCGSVYERSHYKVIFRDQDEKRCEVCNTLIETWSGSRIPTFKLIELAEWPKPPRE